MDNERFLVSTPLGDECDTVTYAQGKHKKYYDPDSKRYRIMDNKAYTKLWNDVDYYKDIKCDKSNNREERENRTETPEVAPMP